MAIRGSDTVLGRYRLEERLGAGGSSEVWRARDEHLGGRPVAVKLLHPHLVADERSRRRLEAEARAAAGLSHPGIVNVYDVEVGDERAAIVFEYVDGERLGDRIAREGALPPREAARIGAEMADALYHAHQRGLIHRDVKPANILLDRSGRARLVDFGIARSLEEGAGRLTATGTVVGTLAYIAPEQLAGEPTGPRTDVYALGAVLYEMLAGSPPFEANGPLALAEMQRVGPAPLSAAPPELAAVAFAALDPNPQRRPRTAAVVATALRDWLAGRPSRLVAAAPAGALPVAAADAAATTQAVAPAGVARSQPAAARRRPAYAAWLLAAALGAGIALAAIALLPALLGGGLPGESPGPTPTPTVAPTPEPTPINGNVQRLLEDFAESCGDATPPPLTGLDRDAARDLLEPLIEACREAQDDD